MSIATPTSSAINAIRKKYKLSSNSSLSVAQYREAFEKSQSKTSNIKDFCFTYNLLKRSDELITIKIEGNHLSKNRFDSLSFRQKLLYKKAFKKGAEILYLQEKKKLRAFKPFPYSTISFVFGTHRSRDHDNNSENIKRSQDTLITLGLIEDDKRLNLELLSIEEEIIKKTEKPYILIKISIIP